MPLPRLYRHDWMDDDVVAPYTPITIDRRTLGVFGRNVTVADSSGFPERIESLFSIQMTRLAKTPRQVLAAPITLDVLDATGQRLAWRAGLTGTPP